MTQHLDIKQFQSELTKHYLNKYSHKDNHKILLETNPNTSDFTITYTPSHTDDDNDNTGKVVPVKPLFISAHVKAIPIHNNVAKIDDDGEDDDLDDTSYYTITSFKNWNLITAQRYTKDKYLLYLNGNQHYLDNQKLPILQKFLKVSYNTTIQPNGTISMKLKSTDKYLDAFVKFISALQFIFNHGSDYVVDNDAVQNQEKELSTMEDEMNEADKKFKADRAKHHHNSKNNPKSKLPKAHGKVVQGFSSTDGTPRQIRYAKIRKKRLERKAYLKAHPKIAKKIEAKKEKEANAIHLANADVITSGRFSVSHAQIVKNLKAVGANYQNSLTKTTQYMVCDKPNKTQKYVQAVKNHVRVINEKQITK